MEKSTEISDTSLDLDTGARLRGSITRLARMLNASAGAEGLTPTGASVLSVVAFHERINLSDLAALEGLNPTMLSRIVGAHDRDGLIERAQNPTDLRVVELRITPKGRLVNDQIRTVRARAMAESLSRLQLDDQDRIRAALPALEDLAHALRAVDPDGH